MAVPKRKTSPSRRKKRRSHDAIKSLNLVADKDTGEYRLSHRLDKTSAMYKGKKVYNILNNAKEAQ